MERGAGRSWSDLIFGELWQLVGSVVVLLCVSDSDIVLAELRYSQTADIIL